MTFLARPPSIARRRSLLTSFELGRVVTPDVVSAVAATMAAVMLTRRIVLLRLIKSTSAADAIGAM